MYSPPPHHTPVRVVRWCPARQGPHVNVDRLMRLIAGITLPEPLPEDHPDIAPAPAAAGPAAVAPSNVSLPHSQAPARPQQARPYPGMNMPAHISPSLPFQQISLSSLSAHK